MDPTTLRRRAERARARDPVGPMWPIAMGVWAQRILGGRWFLAFDPIVFGSQLGSILGTEPTSSDPTSESLLLGPKRARKPRKLSRKSARSTSPAPTRSKSRRRDNLQ